MFDTRLRGLKDRALLQLVAVIPQSLSPTQITALGLVVGLGAALAAALGGYTIALLLFVMNRVLDGLDGLVARRLGKQTDLGGYLDLMADFVVYAALPIGIVYSSPHPSNFWALIVLLASFYVNAASWMLLSALLAKGERERTQQSAQTSLTMPVGLIEGAETIGFYVAFLLFPNALAWLMAAMATLVFVGAAQRVCWATRGGI